MTQINLDYGGDAGSKNAQSVLRVLSRFEAEPRIGIDYKSAHSISELSLRSLARDAGLSLDETRAAVEELVGRHVEGISLDGDTLVLSL